jgi:phosphopantetheinyl transferase (holo-ACP synthase)
MRNRVPELKKNIEDILAHRKEIETQFEKRINARRSKELPYADIEKELKALQLAWDNGEIIARRNLADAEQEAADLEKQEQETQAIRQRAKEITSKASSLRVWLDAGGSEKAFEAAWPEIREEILKNAVVEADKEKPASQFGEIFRTL